jgi:hypothetical protein
VRRDQVLGRVSTKLEQIADENMGRTVMVVSHGACVNVLMRHLLGIPWAPDVKPPGELKIGNTCVCELRYSRDAQGAARWAVHSIGDVAHTEVCARVLALPVPRPMARAAAKAGHVRCQRSRARLPQDPSLLVPWQAAPEEPQAMDVRTKHPFPPPSPPYPSVRFRASSVAAARGARLSAGRPRAGRGARRRAPCGARARCGAGGRDRGAARPSAPGRRAGQLPRGAWRRLGARRIACRVLSGCRGQWSVLALRHAVVLSLRASE